MFDFLTSALAFVFALGIIISVHEAGHLLAAKLFGMKVLAYSIGFGKRIWGFTRGETEYKLAALPLGGYVKLSGEEPGESSDDPRDFLNRPRWQRIVVYLAGPAMNGVLSILLIAGLFMVGVEVPALQAIPPIVGTVEPDSPAAKAGLRTGDEIVAIDGQEVDRWQQAAFTVMTSIGKTLHLDVDRDGDRISLTVVPTRLPDADFGDIGAYPKVLPKIGDILKGSPAERAGFRLDDEVRAVDGRPIASPGDFVETIEGKIGQVVVVTVLRGGVITQVPVTPEDQQGKGKIGVRLMVSERYGPARAFLESLRFNRDIARQSLAVIGKIFKREVAAKSALAGPIEIAAQSGAAARSGFKNLLYLMGVLSLSIGLLNLFPIPVLDGGQIAILLAESVTRRDLSLATKERINQVGLAMIVLLMVTVLYFDISKRF
jgi:regulator of sigma E protease